MTTCSSKNRFRGFVNFERDSFGLKPFFSSYEDYDSDHGEGDEMIDEEDEQGQNVTSDDSGDSSDKQNAGQLSNDINNNDEQALDRNDEPKKYKKQTNDSSSSEKVPIWQSSP